MSQLRRAWVVPFALVAGCWFTPRPTVPDFATQYAGENPVSLINASAIPICYVYLWPSFESSMGGDWLGQNETVASGTRREFRVAPGTFGFRLDACDGSVVQLQNAIDLSGPAEIFLSDGSVPVYAPAPGYQRFEFGVMRMPPPSGGYAGTSGGSYGGTSSGGGYGGTSSGGSYGGTSSGGSSGGTSSGGSYGSTSSGPAMYSLTLHNSCRETVDLYIGDGEPPFGSGTYTNIGSNTTQSESGTLPETIWIVDDSNNPISAFTPREGSQSVQILESCSGFAPY